MNITKPRSWQHKRESGKKTISCSRYLNEQEWDRLRALPWETAESNCRTGARNPFTITLKKEKITFIACKNIEFPQLSFLTDEPMKRLAARCIAGLLILSPLTVISDSRPADCSKVIHIFLYRSLHRRNQTSCITGGVCWCPADPRRQRTRQSSAEIKQDFA